MSGQDRDLLIEPPQGLRVTEGGRIVLESLGEQGQDRAQGAEMLHGVAEHVAIYKAPVVLNVAAGVELVNKSILKVVEDLAETPLAHIAIADANGKQWAYGHVTLSGQDQLRRGPVRGFAAQGGGGEFSGQPRFC